MQARRILVVLTTLTLALAGSASAQPLFAAGQNPADGAQVFRGKGCANCHSVEGAGGKTGPDLGRTARPRTFFDFGASLWNHAPAMAARARASGVTRPKLDMTEMANVAAYLYTLNYFDRPGDVASGRRLFADKRCSTCHAVGGKGGGVGPSLDTMAVYASPISLAAAMWNHGPRMTEVMRERNIARPVLSGAELQDLLAFFRASAPKARNQVFVLPGSSIDGRRVFSEKRCVECHPIVRRNDQEGPDLVEAQRSLSEFAAAMWNKAPAMQRALEARGRALPQLRPDEMADVVSYLYSARYFRQAGNPRNGVLLATNKGCLDCHALYGERGKPAVDLTKAKNLDVPAAMLAALWNHTYINDPRPTREQRPWPRFTGPEMADLLAYLRLLNTAK